METDEFQLPSDSLDTGGQDVHLDMAIRQSAKHSVRIVVFKDNKITPLVDKKFEPTRKDFKSTNKIPCLYNL